MVPTPRTAVGIHTHKYLSSPVLEPGCVCTLINQLGKLCGYNSTTYVEQWVEKESNLLTY